MTSIFTQIAKEISVNVPQVQAAAQMLDEGSTVPFIARYRKELTGGLDDSQLRHLHERLAYLRELEERRNTILKSVKEQGKLTQELEDSILNATTKSLLEDLYLPYKPKRRGKGQVAIEAGLQPLADALLKDPTLDPVATAHDYIDPVTAKENGVADEKAALLGAKYILIERFSEDAKLVGQLRNYVGEFGEIKSIVSNEDTKKAGGKFRDYFDHQERINKIPSHRVLAMLRGRKEGALKLNIDIMNVDSTQQHPCSAQIAQHWGISHQGRAADDWLREVTDWTWRVKLSMHLETDWLSELRERAEKEAISVFSSNLKDLLLAPPAGSRTTLGLDPGLRTGVKVAVVGATGDVLDHTAIYPHAPQKKWQQSIATLATLCKQYQVELVGIGNGTASRETDTLVADLMSQHPELKLTKIMVSEAGASVYSASQQASDELPDLDVSIRGAVSIARRLQDPLAELVKIDPKSIGVGQYQHDVNQFKLGQALDAAVEDCVNNVGVDLNTASVSLLTRVSGLNKNIAENIIRFRTENQGFRNRNSLLKIPRLGAKTFELAAGFLRINDAEHPLDASAVHPEAYTVVESIAQKNNRPLDKLIGDSSFLRSLSAKDYINERFGIPTVSDILLELEKPGRDPRPEFKFAQFKDNIHRVSDLKEGMSLEGVVTNVTNFGAFVDIGVHQDGLVHISELSDTFVKDPRTVVKTGAIVTVKVLEVDEERKRIALSMRSNPETAMAKPAHHNKKRADAQPNNKTSHRQKHPNKEQKKPDKTGTLGELFKQAMQQQQNRS